VINILFFGMIADKVGQQSTTLQGDMLLGDVIAAVSQGQVTDISMVMKWASFHE